MAFRSVFVVKVCSQLALTSSGSLPVRFRVFLMLCWLTFPFIRPSFLGFASKLTGVRQDFERVPEHRIKLISLYPCGSLGQSINFVFGGRVGHFAATPQSDVVGIWSRDLGVVATLSVRQKMPFFVHL